MYSFGFTVPTPVCKVRNSLLTDTRHSASEHRQEAPRGQHSGEPAAEKGQQSKQCCSSCGASIHGKRSLRGGTQPPTENAAQGTEVNGRNIPAPVSAHPFDLADASHWVNPIERQQSHRQAMQSNSQGIQQGASGGCLGRGISVLSFLCSCSAVEDSHLYL